MGKWISKYILYEMIHNFMLDNPDFIYTDYKFIL